VEENKEYGGLSRGGIQVLDIRRGRWWIGKGLFQGTRDSLSEKGSDQVEVVLDRFGSLFDASGDDGLGWLDP
jgi:hypothetical protein